MNTNDTTGHDSTNSQLPKGWRYVELCELVDVLDSKRKPINSKERATRVGNVPYYGAAGQVGTIDVALFDEDLVLLGEDGVQFFDVDKPKAYEISGPSWVNNHAHVLRCHEHTYKQRLLVHFLNQFDYRNRANGTTRLKLTQAAMNGIPVVTPPLDEQERIVEVLEEQLSRLDAALESVRVMREKAAQFRRSLLHAAFTGALTGHIPANGSLPDAWTTTTLGEVCSKPQYGWTTKASPDGVARLLRTTDLTHGPIDWATVPFCQEPPDDIDKYQVRPGDIFISRAGSVGVSVLIESINELSVFASYLIRVRVSEKILAKFLKLFLESPEYWSQITDMSVGVALANINGTKLNTLTIPLPSLHEQELIVRILDEQLSRLDAALAIADEIEKRSAALRRSLLHAAFTGRLTERWRESVHV